MPKVFWLTCNSSISGAPVDDDGFGTICILDEHKRPHFPVTAMLNDMVDEDMSPSRLADECGVDVLQVREMLRWLARIVDGMRVKQLEGGK